MLLNFKTIEQFDECQTDRHTHAIDITPRPAMSLTCATDLIPSREARELAQAFRALGNPHRLAIYLRLLRHAEIQGASVLHSCALQELIDKLDIGAPTISHHIKELVAANLISVTREGKYLRCALNEPMRQRLAGTFDILAHQTSAQAL